MKPSVDYPANTHHWLTIYYIFSNTIGSRGEVFIDDKNVRFPYTVQPKATVPIRVGFDYYNFPAGPVSAKLKVVGKDLKTPLATLIIKGTNENGIHFSNDTIDFGKVTVGTKATQTVTLTLDRRIPSHLPGATIQVVSDNPDITVSASPAEQMIMGAKIEGDQIKFTSDDLPKELSVQYQLTLNKEAPVGPITGSIKLVVPGFPIYVLVKNVKSEVTGEVIKRSK